MRRAIAAALRHLFLPSALLATLLAAAFIYSLWGFAFRRFEIPSHTRFVPDPDDPLSITHEHTDLSIILDRGELWATNAGTYYAGGFHPLRSLASPAPIARLQRWPYNGEIFRDHAGRWSLRLPLWLPVAPALLLSLSTAPPWLAHRRRNRRLRRGQCARCGYNRAGLSDHIAPCPECGQVPTLASSRSRRRREIQPGPCVAAGPTANTPPSPTIAP